MPVQLIIENKVFLMELSCKGIIKISGSQTEKFLQGQLSCNILDVNSSTLTLSAHCDPKGRIISLMQLFRDGDDFYAQVPKESVDITMAHLKKYGVFYKSVIEDVSGSYKMFGFTGHPLPEINAEGYYRLACPGIIPRLELAGPAAVMEKIRNDFSAMHLKSSEAWRLIDIGSGIPAIYPETSGRFLPHRLNLDKLNALSFTKGCYTGQEVIARMHYLGKLKHHMIYLTADKSCSPVRYGAISNQEGNSVGNIVDFCFDHQEKIHILAECEIEAAEHPLFLNECSLTRRLLPYEVIP